MADDKPIYDAARALKRKWTNEPLAGLSDSDMAILRPAIEKVFGKAPVAAQEPATARPEDTKAGTSLSDPGAFYAALRRSFGPLTQSQVDGFNRLLAKMGEAGWPIAWVAYGLATAWHETANRMQPVREGLDASDAWRRRNLRYYPWYGRGDVQLTWERNYKLADQELGLGGSLVANPDRALEPELSARIIVWGMEGGKYTTKGLADYLPRNGKADHRQFKLARYIVNGQDKADKIAGEALKIQDAAEAGGWS